MTQEIATHEVPEEIAHGSGSGDRQRGRLWRVFLAGPVLYSIYFVTVYLLSEFGCFAGLQRLRWFGLDPIRLGIAVATVIAAAAIAAVGVYSYRRWRRLDTEPEDPEEDDPLFMMRVGTWLNGFFTVITILTAIPMLLGSACAWI